MSDSRKKNPYRGSRRFDRTCRCNGSCPWCRGNRLIQTKRELARVSASLREAV